MQTITDPRGTAKYDHRATLQSVVFAMAVLSVRLYVTLVCTLSRNCETYHHRAFYHLAMHHFIHYADRRAGRNNGISRGR